MITPAPPRPGERFRIGGLLLIAVAILDILFMPRLLWSGDPTVWRMETVAILQQHRLWIDPAVVARFGGEPGQYFVLNHTDNYWYSKYGLMNSLLSLPPLAAELAMTGKISPESDLDLILLNLWNITLSLAAAAALFIIATRYAPTRIAALFVMACLFATYLWNYQRSPGSEISQVLFFALTYECLLRSLHREKSPSARWLLLAWLFVALLILTRVFFGILIPAILGIGGGVMCLRRKLSLTSIVALVLPPALILAALASINTVKFGSPWLTGYHQWRPQDHLLTGDFFSAAAGLLFSGHWSIFAYFPVLILALFALRDFYRRHPLDAAILATFFLLSFIVLAKIPSWRGEWTYGPRYMLFILPIASLPALCLTINLPHPWRNPLVLFAAAGLLFSACLQMEVNRADFWLFYHLQDPLEGQLDRDTAEVFLDCPEGILYHDLYAHRQDLDQTTLFHRLRPRLNSDQLETYRRQVQSALDNTNLFWWPPKTDP